MAATNDQILAEIRAHRDEARERDEKLRVVYGWAFGNGRDGAKLDIDRLKRFRTIVIWFGSVCIVTIIGAIAKAWII